jgi:hypothetical protein
MKKDTRIITHCHNTRAEICDHKLKLRLTGSNSNGKSVEFVAVMPFYFAEYLVREMRKAWKAERQYRLGEIARVDAVLPEGIE